MFGPRLIVGPADKQVEAFRTIIDLAIASFLLYRIVIFIKGTKSFQIAMGLLLLLLVTHLVRALDLMVTSWLLEQLWLAAILFVVITYQQEIKKMLGDLAQNSFIAKILASLKKERT